MIDSNVQKLVGEWKMVGGSLQEDSISKLINQLISGGLHKIAVSNDGWMILYQDPDDGRYWELSYPQSELAGGGPPTLSFLRDAEILSKYPSVATQGMQAESDGGKENKNSF